MKKTSEKLGESLVERQVGRGGGKGETKKGGRGALGIAKGVSVVGEALGEMGVMKEVRKAVGGMILGPMASVVEDFVKSFGKVAKERARDIKNVDREMGKTGEDRARKEIEKTKQVVTEKEKILKAHARREEEIAQGGVRKKVEAEEEAYDMMLGKLMGMMKAKVKGIPEAFGEEKIPGAKRPKEGKYEYEGYGEYEEYSMKKREEVRRAAERKLKLEEAKAEVGMMRKEKVEARGVGRVEGVPELGRLAKVLEDIKTDIKAVSIYAKKGVLVQALTEKLLTGKGLPGVFGTGMKTIMTSKFWEEVRGGIGKAIFGPFSDVIGGLFKGFEGVMEKTFGKKWYLAWTSKVEKGVVGGYKFVTKDMTKNLAKGYDVASKGVAKVVSKSYDFIAKGVTKGFGVVIKPVVSHLQGVFKGVTGVAKEVKGVQGAVGLVKKGLSATSNVFSKGLKGVEDKVYVGMDYLADVSDSGFSRLDERLFKLNRATSLGFEDLSGEMARTGKGISGKGGVTDKVKDMAVITALWGKKIMMIARAVIPAAVAEAVGGAVTAIVGAVGAVGAAASAVLLPAAVAIGVGTVAIKAQQSIDEKIEEINFLRRIAKRAKTIVPTKQVRAELQKASAEGVISGEQYAQYTKRFKEAPAKKKEEVAKSIIVDIEKLKGVVKPVEKKGEAKIPVSEVVKKKEEVRERRPDLVAERFWGGKGGTEEVRKSMGKAVTLLETMNKTIATLPTKEMRVDRRPSFLEIPTSMREFNFEVYEGNF